MALLLAQPLARPHGHRGPEVPTLATPAAVACPSARLEIFPRPLIKKMPATVQGATISLLRGGKAQANAQHKLTKLPQPFLSVTVLLSSLLALFPTGHGGENLKRELSTARLHGGNAGA